MEFIHLHLIGQTLAEAVYIVIAHLQFFDGPEGILDVLITTRKACINSPERFRRVLRRNIHKWLKRINGTQHACILFEPRQDQRASMLNEVLAKLQETWKLFDECSCRESSLRLAALKALNENYASFHMVAPMSQHVPRVIIACASHDEEETITALISDERKMEKNWLRFWRPHYFYNGIEWVLKDSTREFMIERCQLHHLEQSKKWSPDGYSRVTGVSHIIRCSILDFV